MLRDTISITAQRFRFTFCFEMVGKEKSCPRLQLSCRTTITFASDRASGTAVEEVGRRVAFIASGDLSHRLKPQAPAGYNPDAHV
jgi:aromatic ring-opening dioxygenase catalytic subunit (LigB family)